MIFLKVLMQLSEDILKNLGFEHFYGSGTEDHPDCFRKSGFELQQYDKGFYITATALQVHTIDELKSEYFKRTGLEL